MTTQNKNFTGTLLLVTALVLSACSKSALDNKTVIVGSWQVEGEKSTVEFKADGTIQGNDDGTPEKGTYKFTDPTHLQMSIDLGAGETNAPAGASAMMTLDCTVTVKDNDNVNMSMTLPGDATATSNTEVVHLKRIK